MSRLFRLTHRERLRSAGWSPGVQGPGIRGRDGGARGRGQRPGRIAEGTGPPSTRPAGLPVTQPGSLVVLGVKANLERDGKAVKVVESASADVPAEGHTAGPLPLRTLRESSHVGVGRGRIYSSASIAGVSTFLLCGTTLMKR